MNPGSIEDMADELGVPDPSLWRTASHWELTQLAFLRQLWLAFPDPTDASWLQSALRGEARSALERLRAQDAAEADVLTVARSVAKDFLYLALQLQADPNHDKPSLNQFRWGFWGEDGSGKPVKRLNGTHELLDVFEGASLRLGD